MHDATGKVTPDALAALSGASGRNREERSRVLGLLDQLRDTLLAERAARIEAQAEVERLNGVVDSLREQNRQLDDMLGLAVRLANEEISESGGMLAEAMATMQRDAALAFPPCADQAGSAPPEAGADAVAGLGFILESQAGLRPAA